MTEKSEQSCRLWPPNARLFCVCHMSLDNGSGAVTLFYYHANTGWHAADSDRTRLSLDSELTARIGVVKCRFGRTGVLFVSCEVTKETTCIVRIIVKVFEATYPSPPAWQTSSSPPRRRWRCPCPPPTGWWWWGCELSLWHSCENDLWPWAGFHFSSSCQWRGDGRAPLQVTQSLSLWF